MHAKLHWNGVYFGIDGVITKFTHIETVRNKLRNQFNNQWKWEWCFSLPSPPPLSIFRCWLLYERLFIFLRLFFIVTHIHFIIVWLFCEVHKKVYHWILLLTFRYHRQMVQTKKFFSADGCVQSTESANKHNKVAKQHKKNSRNNFTFLSKLTFWHYSSFFFSSRHSIFGLVFLVAFRSLKCDKTCHWMVHARDTDFFMRNINDFSQKKTSSNRFKLIFRCECAMNKQRIKTKMKSSR